MEASIRTHCEASDKGLSQDADENTLASKGRANLDNVRDLAAPLRGCQAVLTSVPKWTERSL